jgi:hypothetical protein
MNPNIRALQFAEQELREHDRRAKEMSDELRELKRGRAAIAARVQECIDVLCGKAQPDLFAGVDQEEEEHRADGAAEYQAAERAAEQVPGPVVCAPVGSARLADIPGLTKHDAACLGAVGLNTLADLQRECDDDLEKIAETLSHWAGAFTAGEAARIQEAVARHLNPASVPAEPTGVQYPPGDKWRSQGLALMGLNEKLLKACKKEEVLTVGELHDWIDEEARQVGGFFGESGAVLVNELARIGKIAQKWAKANADILFQFFADKGFTGVPTKEEVAAL